MRTNGRWPGRPILQQDESFSSWFVRVAAANGLRPGELLQALQPGADRGQRDLDRHADPHLLKAAADGTGQSFDILNQATFRRWAGSVYGHDDGLNKIPWLPPAGRQGGTRSFGQQLCPHCLAADGRPYLRLTWRLSFMTACPVHGHLLLDRCPSCNEPFHVERLDLRQVRCGFCGNDLRHHAGDEPTIDPLPVQDALSALVERGWMQLGDYGPQYSFVVLDILALLMRLLSGGRHAYALRGWVGEHEPDLAVSPETIPRVREGALLTTRARSVLVPMAHWLLTDWPLRFVTAADAAGMSSRDLIKRPDGLYPFAYAYAVDWHLRQPAKRGNWEEVESAKEVLRARGSQTGLKELIEACGSKRRTIASLADPVATGAAWGQGRYWKLDGVSPEVKEAVRSAAHRAGEGVGPWLDRLLRQELGISASKIPSGRQSPDTISTDRL